MLLFVSLLRKQCTLERDVQKGEVFSSGADWGTLSRGVLCCSLSLELGSAALTAN